MIATPAVIDVPLRADSDGVIRIGKTRVTLVTLINFYKQGQSAEDLHRGFPTIPLADIYAVIAYYLAHQTEVDAYIRRIEAEGEEIRRKIEALPTNKPLTREMLLARLADKQRKQE